MKLQKRQLSFIGQQIGSCWSEEALASKEHEGTYWDDGCAFDCGSGCTNVYICQNSSTCAYIG